MQNKNKYESFFDKRVHIFNRSLSFIVVFLASDLDIAYIHIKFIYNCNYLTNVMHNNLKTKQKPKQKQKERNLH